MAIWQWPSMAMVPLQATLVWAIFSQKAPPKKIQKRVLLLTVISQHKLLDDYAILLVAIHRMDVKIIVFKMQDSVVYNIGWCMMCTDYIILCRFTV